MLSLIKRLFTKNKQYTIVTKKVDLNEFIKGMQFPKDITIELSSDGSQIATCNQCDVKVHVIEQNDLIWHICPSCNKKSFGAKVNLKRDISIAKAHGGKFIYQIYYFKELPEKLAVPEYENRSTFEA